MPLTPKAYNMYASGECGILKTILKQLGYIAIFIPLWSQVLM